MLVGDYGSDSEGEDSTEFVAAPPPPPPVKPQKRGPKKITVALPALSKHAADEVTKEDERPAKKPRLAATGAGRSALLSMLPAPKDKNPKLPPPERVLGGGKGPGLVFTRNVPTYEPSAASERYDFTPREDAPELAEPSVLFRPTSIGKGKANISLEEGKKATAPAPRPAAPVVDFFSLGSTSKASTSAPSFSSAPSISSAPVVEEFTPPEPSQSDEYPGYYCLPSGQWAAHDTTYFAKFYNKWQKEYNAQVRALEKGMSLDLEAAGATEVDAMEVMELAKKEVQERNERKALTLGLDEPKAVPKMNIKSVGSKGARTRGQLSSMLSEAYQNRELLEERIAQGKRNRKEAGNKYGF